MACLTGTGERWRWGDAVIQRFKFFLSYDPPSSKSLQLSSFGRQMEKEKEDHTQEIFLLGEENI